MPRGRLAWEDEREQAAARPDAAPAPAPPVSLRALQQGAGNQAVARLLAREPSGTAWTPQVTRPATPDLGIAGGSMGKVKQGYTEASETVATWIQGRIQALQGATAFPESIAELVAAARALEYATGDGGRAKVGDVLVGTAGVEGIIRAQAKARGVEIPGHRDASDIAGTKQETIATLANLGAKLPTEFEFGGDAAKLTVTIGGKVGAEAKLGRVELEGEASSRDGAEASAKTRTPVGKAGLTVSSDGTLKGSLAAGDLKITGSVARKDDGVQWSATIQFGSLGSVATADDIAKVIQGAQATFAKGATALGQGIDPMKLQDKGGDMVDAVKKVVEKAQASAKQGGRSGWQLGASVKGTDGGGVSGSITFTWVF